MKINKFDSVFITLLCISVISCGGGSSNDDENKNEKKVGTSNKPSFTISSSDYDDGGVIPVIHADDEGDAGGQWCANGDAQNLSPQYTWENAPEGTVSYALIMDDETPPCGTGDDACRHWAVYNIPFSVNSFVRDVDTSQIPGVVEADPGFYVGPCPPENDNHTYITTIYALSINPDLVGNTHFSRSEFEANYTNEILDKADITGTYIFVPQN